MRFLPPAVCLTARSLALPLFLGGGIVVLAQTDAQPSVAFPVAAPHKQEDFSTCIPGQSTIFNAEVEYVLYVPAGLLNGAPAKSPDSFPLIVQLHGAANAEFTGAQNKASDIFQYAERATAQNASFPFFILAPVMPGGRGDWLDQEAHIFSIIDRLAAHFPIDRDRIYLTGTSMGGFGAWNLAMHQPAAFAAMAPVCAAGNPTDVWKISQMPIWVFHGAKDPTVFLSKAQEMVEALKLCGNDAVFTVFPNLAHDIGAATYHNPELYQWFLKHRRNKEWKENPAARVATSTIRGTIITPGVMMVTNDADRAWNVKLCVKNSALATGEVSLAFAPHDTLSIHPAHIAAALPPGSEKTIELQVQVKPDCLPPHPTPAVFEWTTRYQANDREIMRTGRQALSLVSYLPCPPATQLISIDGQFSDWGDFPFKVDEPEQILNAAESYHGPDDCRYAFALTCDEHFLYVAVKVTDDRSILDPGKTPWQQDGVEIRIDARDEKTRCAEQGHRPVLLAALSPARSRADPMVCFDRTRMPAGLLAACVKTTTGFNAEIAVPAAYLDSLQGGKWKSFALNIAVNDYDVEEKGAQLWWHPDWRAEAYLTGAGSFRHP